MKNGKTCFGVIIGTRAYFNSELAKDVRKQLLKTLDEGGYEYIILPEDATPTGSSSIETREDGLKVSKLSVCLTSVLRLVSSMPSAMPT